MFLLADNKNDKNFSNRRGRMAAFCKPGRVVKENDTIL